MKISVITASYNYEKYIKASIESVMNQTYEDWELIVVDDGSTDSSLEIIKSYMDADKRIKLFTHNNNENKGLKETLLLGIEKAESEWIAFLESDDIWSSTCLAKRAEIIKDNPSVGLVFNNIELFGDSERIKGTLKIIKPIGKMLSEKTFPKNMFFDLALSNILLTFSAVTVKKEFLKTEYFNTPIDKLLDWWLYIHIANETDFYYMPENLTKWRLHKESYISHNNKQKFCLVNISAYWDIYNQTKPDFKLYWFIIFSTVLFIFKNARKTRMRLIREIKRRLGLPLKDSPLF